MESLTQLIVKITNIGKIIFIIIIINIAKQGQAKVCGTALSVKETT